MAQSLELNIKTTSDVPQAMDKAKQATVSFGKQVEDIQKKFSTAFKDVFLSFLGPMALLGVAINYIGKLIEENQKKHREANQAAIDGTNELMSAEDRYYSRKLENERKDKENREQASIQRIKVTEDFLTSKDPRAKEILRREYEKQTPLAELAGGTITAYGLARDPKIQNEVQKIIAEEASKAGIKTPDKNAANFKGPEGFSNVVGVGANPVMEAMDALLEETKKTNEILMDIKGRNQPIKDFTKREPYQEGYGDQM